MLLAVVIAFFAVWCTVLTIALFALTHTMRRHEKIIDGNASALNQFMDRTKLWSEWVGGRVHKIERRAGIKSTPNPVAPVKS